MNDTVKDILARVEAKRLSEVCSIDRWFEALEEHFEGTGTDIFDIVQKMLDAGLRLRPPGGYVEHNSVIEKIDQEIPIIRDRVVQETRTLAGFVEPDVGEKRTLVSIPQIERSNYLKVCESIGLYNPPWPDDEHAIAFQIQLKIGKLESKRNKIEQEDTEGKYSPGRQKREELKEIDAQIEAHWQAFKEFTVTQNADLFKVKIPKTANAQKAKVLYMGKRHAALRLFIREISDELRKGNFNWDLQNIPVTKADFRRVALRRYPILSKHSPATINNDLQKFGLRFRPGTKDRKNNILESFFSTPKPT